MQQKYTLTKFQLLESNVMELISSNQNHLELYYQTVSRETTTYKNRDSVSLLLPIIFPIDIKPMQKINGK